MSDNRESAPIAWMAVARIVKTHGVRGELAADLETDFPERFSSLTQVSLLQPNGTRQAFRLSGHRFHQDRVLLTLDGIGDMDAARAWIGAEVQVPASGRLPAPAGAYYLSDLAGCSVNADGAVIGRIEWVETGGAAPALLHVRGSEGREILIPFVRDYLERVDLEERTIVMHLPVGLLDINP